MCVRGCLSALLKPWQGPTQSAPTNLGWDRRPVLVRPRRGRFQGWNSGWMVGEGEGFEGQNPRCHKGGENDLDNVNARVLCLASPKSEMGGELMDAGGRDPVLDK